MTEERNPNPNLPRLTRGRQAFNRHMAITSMVCAIICSALVMGVGYLAIHNNHVGNTNRELAKELVRVRTENLIASCIQFNVAAETSRQAENRSSVIGADNIAPKPRAEQTERAVQKYLKEQHEATIEGHPYRDCSKKGIAEYLNNPPLDPATSTTTLTNVNRTKKG